MRKVYGVLILLLLAFIGALSYYYIQKSRNAHHIPKNYSYLFSIGDKDARIDIYSLSGELGVGENKLYIVLKEGNKLTSLYFYMPPMPGMGEMREYVLLTEKSKGIYEGSVDISMAGEWQVIAEVDNTTIKTVISIPFRKREEASTESISLHPEKLQLLGVQVEEIKKRELRESFYTVGYVSYDLSRVYEITLRSDAWVIDTYGRFEGEKINRGVPLLRVLSPESEIARRELTLAKEMGREDLEKAVLERLSYLRAGEILYSPYEGVILEKRVFSGGFLRAGDVAYRIADTSKVWVIAEVPLEYAEQVKRGMSVVINPVGSTQSIRGRVDYIFPEADRKARTIKARISLPAKGLKINQLVEVHFEKPVGEVLAVPESAVVDTGRRQVVFVEVERGLYEPRVVKLGKKLEDYYEVIDGLSEGERVVVKGTFLLDSEAQLKGLYEKKSMETEELRHHHHH